MRPIRVSTPPAALGRLLADQVAAFLPAAVTEYRFHQTRKWRFDVAWPSERVAVEIEGGAYVAGRHSRGAGFEADIEKYAEAACLGWTVLRALPKHVRDGTAAAWLRRIADASP